MAYYLPQELAAAFGALIRMAAAGRTSRPFVPAESRLPGACHCSYEPQCRLPVACCERASRSDDEGTVRTQGTRCSTTINHYGPVIGGNAYGAQLAWGNHTVYQSRSHVERAAPGFELLVQAVADTLEKLPTIGLSPDNLREARAAAEDVLNETTQAEPDRGTIRRAVNALKGLLAPVALGVTAGSVADAQEWARTAIEQLSMPF